jgi:hypothetical protein
MHRIISFTVAPLAGALFVLVVTSSLAARRLEAARAGPELHSSSLGALCLQWRAGHVAAAGDPRARMALGPDPGLSPPRPRATGAIELDLLEGVVAARPVAAGGLDRGRR